MELPASKAAEDDTGASGESKSSVSSLISRVEELILTIERTNLMEYTEMVRRPARMLWMNFIAGLARGLGMAIGFTLLGALVIYLMQKAVVLNLPVISNFIAEIIKMVQSHMVIQRM